MSGKTKPYEFMKRSDKKSLFVSVTFFTLSGFFYNFQNQFLSNFEPK